MYVFVGEGTWVHICAYMYMHFHGTKMSRDGLWGKDNSKNVCVFWQGMGERGTRELFCISKHGA